MLNKDGERVVVYAEEVHDTSKVKEWWSVLAWKAVCIVQKALIGCIVVHGVEKGGRVICKSARSRVVNFVF